MLFNSLEFIVFLLVVLPTYYVLPHKKQNVFLLLASTFFYASWSWKFIFPLLFSTIIDYYCAKRMEALILQGAPQSARRPYLVFSLITNLGLLAFFKYFNFFAENLQAVLNSIGLSNSQMVFEIILPIGISFYTFQALSYTIDVYRGQMHATKSFYDFLLAVLYFPHLVAGPIQRAHDLISQITNPRKITKEKLLDGTHLIACGFLKKVFIADNLSPYVDQIFASSGSSGFEVLLATYAFAIQIYCDFSGYTDIARGLAKLMGFEFVLNFNLPYFATNPRDFWKRWHISLSAWLRDYLYTPLGGNRGSTYRTYRNLMLTMIIGGFWHGAAWNFILWGTYHGILLVTHRLVESILPLRKAEGNMATQSKVSLYMKIFFMFHFTCYGWLLFRATSLTQIGEMSLALLSPFEGFEWALVFAVAPFILPLLLFQATQYRLGRLDIFKTRNIPYEFRIFAYSVVAYLVIFRGGLPQSFIYFQF